jgi:pimeloyl-ACP methyl ester carboxylesterase
MTDVRLTTGVTETARHRTTWLAAGPEDGPLMIFIHGCPGLSITWRPQIAHFASQGWRCIAPDMRGRGGSSVPDTIAAYTVRELVGDMIELHEALGGSPAVWVGHDWGGPVAWAMASHHPDRCRGVVNLGTPYLARGLALPTLVPLVDRTLYPEDQFPVGQWDYWLFYREHFALSVADFEADVESTLRFHYRRAGPREKGKPVITAQIRANGGWFGEARRAPLIPGDSLIMSDEDFTSLVAASRITGFAAENAWYMNDEANLTYAAEARNFGKLTVPALFIHATRDQVCDTTQSRLAEPMREDVPDLTEVTIDCGHEIQLERPDETNAAISDWIKTGDLLSLSPN